MEHYDDFLEHYGVKGMKWGKHKRKTNQTNSTISRNNSGGMSPEYEEEKDYNGRRNKYLVPQNPSPPQNSMDKNSRRRPLKNDPLVSDEYRRGFESNVGLDRRNWRPVGKQKAKAKDMVDRFISGLPNKAYRTRRSLRSRNNSRGRRP